MNLPEVEFRSASRAHERKRTNSTTLSAGVFPFEQDGQKGPRDGEVDPESGGGSGPPPRQADEDKGKGRYRTFSTSSHPTSGSSVGWDENDTGDENGDGDVPSLIGSPDSFLHSPDRQGRMMSRARGESVDMVLGTPGTPDWGRWMEFGFDAPERGPEEGVMGKGKGRAEEARVVGMDVGTSGRTWDEREREQEPEVRMMGALRLGPVLLGPVSRHPTPDIPSRRTTPTPMSIRLPAPQEAAGPQSSSSTKKDLPQWLKNRPRSSSSASLASKFSLTSTGSMGSLSSRLGGVRAKIKNKIGKKEEVQTEEDTAEAVGKKEPKGLMRRLMVRRKTTPVLARSGPTTRTKLDGAHASGTIVSPRRSSMGLSDVFATSSLERRVSASAGTREAETDEPEREVVAQEVVDDLGIAITARDEEVPVLKALSFQEKLPRELQVMVMQAVIDLHVGDHQRLVEQGRWKGEVARQRWYGETAGRRELLSLRRVCAAWNDVILDGQLWSRCAMTPYLDRMPPSTLVKILRASSSCVRELDTAGWRNLPGGLLISALQAKGATQTGLEKLDLQGCTEIDPHDLWWLIKHSPRLKWLSLRGLSRVHREHMQAINECVHLEYLDIGFCRNLPENSVLEFAASTHGLPMRELRISGFAGTVATAAIGGCLLNLETLDMSYCSKLSDDDIKELVTPLDWEWKPAFAQRNAVRHRSNSALMDERTEELIKRTAFLTSSQAGQSSVAFTGSNGLVPRRILSLKKLVISQCPRLTDQSCQYLAHAVPHLQIFEMANADGNSNIQTAGLVDLFETCPYIRKIDLEGALDIDDDLLTTLTPRAAGARINPIGSLLETVCFGFAGNLTAGAMLGMIRNCTRLKHFDIDNTTASDLLVKEFVRKRGRSTVLSVVDCRGVSRNVVEALESRTRPRNGWRGWQAAPLRYQDGSRLGGGPDECSDAPVVQSFWTWNRVPRADRPVSMSYERDRFRSAAFDTEHLPDTENSCIIM